MGDKLPENERPSIESIYAAVNNTFSKSLQSLFIVDAQNDCNCKIESYDLSEGAEILYLTDDGIVRQNGGAQLALPMLTSIHETQIVQLLQQACERGRGDPSPGFPSHRMLYNPKSPIDKLWKMYEHSANLSVHVRRDGTFHDWHPFDWVPEDRFYLLPDVENFGVLSANIGKFGCLIITNYIREVKIDVQL